jgi:hypothetical protein
MDDGWGDVIYGRLEERGVISHLKANVWKHLEEGTEKDMKIAIKDIISTSNMNVLLSNSVYQEKIKLNKDGVMLDGLMISHEETLDYVKCARKEMDSHLLKRMKELSEAAGIPLYREREQSESSKLQKKWTSIGSLKFEHSKVDAIYTSSELLEWISMLRNVNINTDRLKLTGRLVPLYFTSNNLTKMKAQYSQLNPSHLEGAYIKKASNALQLGHYESARDACRCGCFNEDRSTLWPLALGVNISLTECSFHFNKLKSKVLKISKLLDDVIIKDIKVIPSNDVECFVFEDILHQILLCFIRDANSLSDDSSHEFIPIKGFSMLAAPLCYIYQQVEKLYKIFKILYTRYFHMLHSMSSNDKNIIGLCCLFESLMFSKNPELFQYIILLGSHPLKLAFPWITSAFAGYLSIDQLLLLWDLIIGYDSLEILPVMAVSLLEFRAKSLFQATTLNDIEVKKQFSDNN